MGAVVEEIVFVLYALVLVLLFFASLFVIVQDYHALQRHHEPPSTIFVSISGNSKIKLISFFLQSGLIFFSLIILLEIFVNFVYAFGNSIGLGTTLYRLNFVVHIIWCIVPLLLLTAWRHLELVFLKQSRSEVPLEMETIRGKRNKSILDVLLFRSSASAPDFVLFLRWASWFFTAYLIAVGVASLASHPTLISRQDANILYYVQEKTPAFSWIPLGSTAPLLLIYGLILVVYTSACLKEAGAFYFIVESLDTEDKTSFIWIGISLAIAPVAPALGYALGGNYKLFTGKAAELILVVAFLLCERERGKILEDRVYRKLRQEGNESWKKLSASRLSHAMRL